jgi:hypothetical protein
MKDFVSDGNSLRSSVALRSIDREEILKSAFDGRVEFISISSPSSSASSSPCFCFSIRIINRPIMTIAADQVKLKGSGSGRGHIGQLRDALAKYPDECDLWRRSAVPLSSTQGSIPELLLL